jgi:hypothetical protein
MIACGQAFIDATIPIGVIAASTARDHGMASPLMILKVANRMSAAAQAARR